MIIAARRAVPDDQGGIYVTEGRKIEKIPEDAPVIMWKDSMSLLILLL